MSRISVLNVPPVRAGALSTGETLCWTMALFSVVSMASPIWRWMNGVPGGAAAFDALEVIAWCCALRLVVSDPNRTTQAAQSQIMLPIAFGLLAVAANGRFATLALIPLALMMLRGEGWSSAQRRAAVIMLAIGMKKMVAILVPTLLGDIVLRLDTAAAGLLMQYFVPGTSWHGNTLRPPGDVGITVAIPCSSFANLSRVMLCFTAFYTLDGGHLTRRAIGVISLICAAVIILNTIRLVATARSLDSYIYWHDGAGAQIFGVTMTLVTVIACSIGSRWAARWR